MNSFFRTLAVFVMLPACIVSHAQLSHGGQAFGLMEHGPRLHPAPVHTVVSASSVSQARAQNAVSSPHEFGEIRNVALGMEHGIWTDLENGDRIWRMTIHAPGAESIGFHFDEYVVPHGALVFVYNEHGRQRGAFMAAPAGRSTLAMDQTIGERITIEYYEPAALYGMGALTIDQVIVKSGGDRDFGDSGECNVNVVCPTGDGWENQIRSTVLINTGSTTCTGTLINSCAQDATPYVLTSNQCIGGNPENYTFRFNWDSPACFPSEVPEWDNTITGAQILVSDFESDVALLRLDEVPPPYYQVYFSGWDTTGAVPSSVAAIHHPVGDVKKISRYYSSPFSIDSLSYWVVQQWSEGIVESGSTGCGLWDQNGAITGHYVYGISSCDTTIFDYFSKFADYYHLLKPHIGDCSSNLPGLDWNPVIPILVDASITSITNVEPLVCGSNTITPQVTLKNNGPTVITSALITYGLQGGIPSVAAWSGVLLPGQTYNHLLPPLLVPPGDHILEITSNSPNGEDDDWPFNDNWTLPFSVSSPAHMVDLFLQTDNFGSDVTWELATENDIILYEGGPYDDVNNGEAIHRSFCLTNGCYTFTIHDTFGDGICCQYGLGNYVLQDGNGTVFVISNGEYEFENEHVFCLEAVSVAENELAAHLEMFPNPTTGMLTLRSDRILDKVQVMDGLGRIVLVHGQTGRDLTLDLSGLAEGVYMVEVTAQDQRTVERVVVQ